jgi:hypothetical protein
MTRAPGPGPAGLAGHEAMADRVADPGRLLRCHAVVRRVTKAPPLDARNRRYWPYVIMTCALPAAATFIVVMWRPRWAWWALAAELTAIAVLTVTWRIVHAHGLGRPSRQPRRT